MTNECGQLHHDKLQTYVKFPRVTHLNNLKTSSLLDGYIGIQFKSTLAHGIVQ